MKAKEGKWCFVFRVDSSDKIGSGHIMRCLTLADFVRPDADRIEFICRSLPGNLAGFVEKKGYPLRLLPPVDVAQSQGRHEGYRFDEDTIEKDADMTRDFLEDYPKKTTWLVVDHYGLDSKWEARIRPCATRVMAIDDLADRRHDCDLILDQNYYHDMETRYVSLVPEQCRVLAGPRFALLRPEFLHLRNSLRQRSGEIKRLLVFFGASDLTNETEKTLRAVTSYGKSELEVDVLIGVNNRHRDSIETMAASMNNVTCYFHTPEAAYLMAAADVYIGTPGTTTWERCCLGLPSVIITTDSTQVNATINLAEKGVLYYLGHSEQVKESDIASILDYFSGNPSLLADFSRKSAELVDGHGTRRCYDEMNRFSIENDGYS